MQKRRGSVHVAYRVPKHFDKHVRQNEGLPVVGLGGSFPRFVQSPLGDKHWHDLVDQLEDNKEKQEQGKQLVLQSLLRVVGLEEGESDKDGLSIHD
jgi:hypothetical protein